MGEPFTNLEPDADAPLAAFLATAKPSKQRLDIEWPDEPLRRTWLLRVFDEDGMRVVGLLWLEGRDA